MQAPVFRALYSEKQVVQEERRLRVDNSPMGRWQESFLAAAFANNYGRPVIGYSEDVAGLGRREVQQFFNEHYGPLRLTVSVVGDVQASQVGPVHLPPPRGAWIMHPWGGIVNCLGSGNEEMQASQVKRGVRSAEGTLLCLSSCRQVQLNGLSRCLPAADHLSVWGTCRLHWWGMCVHDCCA